MEKKFRHLTVYRDHGAADTKDIEDFEKKYQICFPNIYKELMLKHNGAYFEESSFDFTNLKGEEDGRSFLFKTFTGKSLKDDGGEPIEEAQLVSDPNYYGVPGLIGFASTAEGDTICFDYRDDSNTCEPKIIVLVHDEFDDYENGTSHRHVEPVADSFDAFLDMLYEYVDDEG